jgi:hypothetical protein
MGYRAPAYNERGRKPWAVMPRDIDSKHRESFSVGRRQMPEARSCDPPRSVRRADQRESSWNCTVQCAVMTEKNPIRVRCPLGFAHREELQCFSAVFEMQSCSV